MTGDSFAQISLRIDGVYCMVLGVFVAASAPIVASATELPLAFLVLLGTATVVWGAYVWRAGSRQRLKAHTRLVMIANIGTSGLLAVTGVVAGTDVLMLCTAVLAVDVAAFALSQGLALHRMRAETA